MPSTAILSPNSCLYSQTSLPVLPSYPLQQSDLSVGSSVNDNSHANLTKSQERFFEAYKEGKNIFAYGCAGTGKTFAALYLALKDVLDPLTPFENVYLVRSLVSTREIGFLPGDHEDKSFLYQIPYKHMVKFMFEMADDTEFELLYGALKSQETVKFWSTSFIRGTTLDLSLIHI